MKSIRFGIVAPESDSEVSILKPLISMRDRFEIAVSESFRSYFHAVSIWGTIVELFCL